MNSQQISDVLETLKVNSRGQIRGKDRANDKLRSLHLTEQDKTLMDIRVYVAKLSTAYSSKEIIKMIDEHIYKIQTN